MGRANLAAAFAITIAGMLFIFGERATAQEEPKGETEPATEKPVAPAAKEKADDWDTAGPVDKTPHISGSLMMSWRYTNLTENTLADGTEVEDFNTFQVEHTHIKFFGDLSEKLSWEIMPCVTHMNDFSVVTVHFVYKFLPELQLTAGRFLLPFGQFNVRSLPGSYNTVSRPLLYLSHEDRALDFGQTPTPSNFIFTPRDDIGGLLSGSFWLGPDDIVQLSYNAYLTNGLRAISDQASRFWDDNNSGKQFGGRVSGGYIGDPVNVTLGGSVLRNKYEDSLGQFAWGLDAVASYEYKTARRITVRGEYVDMEREIQPTTTLLSGDEGIRGAYVTLEGNITEKVGAYYQWDTLQERTPEAQINQTSSDLKMTMNRHAVGLSFLLGGNIQLRGEYSLWLVPLGLPNAHRVSVQTVVTF